ncbi:hypothetical protein ACE38W_02755 [Chitinophaga sp. Hz27]|uniref:hypothetical protein n=1 Tax=Chitinophaga sp. Hz27 TaxID=3347169 RepID=UPI0035D84878
MPLELEHIKEGLYYRYKNSIVRIEEIHYPFLPIMRHAMEAIIIENNELFMLGFETWGRAGEFIRHLSNDRSMGLKRTNNTGWGVWVNGADLKTELQFVHEIQEMWLVLFREVLRRKGDEPKPPLKLVYYQMKNSTAAVKTGIETKGRYAGKFINYSEVIPYQQQLYYVTWDCTFVFRNISVAIWMVTEPTEAKDILFEFEGRKWGLELVAGKGTTDKDTRAAGKWLHHHLAENVYKRL